MTHLPTFSFPPETTVAPVFPSVRSIELGLRNITFKADDWRVQITLSDEVDPKREYLSAAADIFSMTLHGRLVLTAADRTMLSEAGITALDCRPVAVAVPRSLWRFLPGGREALRLRVRAWARLKNGRVEIEAEALHLFPAKGCRDL